MNRSDFVKSVASEKGISSRQAYNSVNAVMDTLRFLLSNGEKSRSADSIHLKC